MGSIWSKRNEPKEGSSTNNSSNSNIPDVASYESALRTTIVIESNVDDIDEQVVKFILQSKEDIWHNSDLPDLVKEYFSSSSEILTFYSALEICIKKIRNGHSFIQLAITRFDKGKNEPGNRFSETVRELESFKSTGDPFTDDLLFGLFCSVNYRLPLMLSKLRSERGKLDRKLKGLRSYRKVFSALFAAVFVAVVIWSVLAVAIAEPPLAAALLAACSAPLGTVGQWMSLLWKGHEGGVKKELDLVLEMEIETFTAVIELQNIRMLVENLKLEIETMLFKAGVAVEKDDEVAVSLVINEIKKNLAAFMQPVDVLGEQSYKYSRDIGRAREEILQRMKNY